MGESIKIIVLLTVAGVLIPAHAHAQGIYKCISKDGGTTYSQTPCPGAKELSPGTSAAQLQVQKLSLREANLAYECSDALDFLLLNPADTSPAIRNELGRIRQQFDNFCPRFGYRPFTRETAKYNENVRGTLNPRLRQSHPDAPSGTRVYDSNGRDPPLFSGY